MLTLPVIIAGQPAPIGVALVILGVMLTVHRFGVLAGAVAISLMMATPGLHLIASGEGPYVASGVVAWGLILLPGALAAFHYARSGSSDPAGATSPS